MYGTNFFLDKWEFNCYSILHRICTIANLFLHPMNFTFMSEGILDLTQLEVEQELMLLKTIQQSEPLYRRNSDRIILILSLISFIFLFYRLFYSSLAVFYSALLLLILIWYRIGVSIIGTYQITDKGLVIPYTWFTRKTISWVEILSVNEISLRKKGNDISVKGYEVELDTPISKFNITGMQSPVLYLTEEDFEFELLTIFMKTLKQKKEERADVPNTLAERLDLQVTRAWKGRYTHFLLKILEGFSRSLVYLSFAEVFFWSVFQFSLFPWVGGIFLLFLLIINLLIHYDALPSAIIGIRPHELGPLLYEETNMVTNVRFIIKSYPDDVEVMNCVMIHDEDAIKQPESIKEIQPCIVSAGQLRHVVAQVRGNHSKAIGAIVTFRYLNDPETSYNIDLLW